MIFFSFFLLVELLKWLFHYHVCYFLEQVIIFFKLASSNSVSGYFLISAYKQRAWTLQHLLNYLGLQCFYFPGFSIWFNESLYSRFTFLRSYNVPSFRSLYLFMNMFVFWVAKPVRILNKRNRV